MMRDSWLVLLTQLQTEMTAVPKFPLLIQICSVLQFVLMLPILWIGVVAVLGLTRRKKDFPLVRKINRFAIVVCARNEETALPSLLESGLSGGSPACLSVCRPLYGPDRGDRKKISFCLCL